MVYSKKVEKKEDGCGVVLRGGSGRGGIRFDSIGAGRKGKKVKGKKVVGKNGWKKKGVRGGKKSGVVCACKVKSRRFVKKRRR